MKKKISQASKPGERRAQITPATFTANVNQEYRATAQSVLEAHAKGQMTTEQARTALESAFKKATDCLSWLARAEAEPKAEPNAKTGKQPSLDKPIQLRR